MVCLLVAGCAAAATTTRGTATPGTVVLPIVAPATAPARRRRLDVDVDVDDEHDDHDAGADHRRSPLLPVPVPPPPEDGSTEPRVEVGLLEIPAIGLSRTIFEGIRLSTLDNGPGHWPGSAMPGEIGNVVLAGHRVSSNADFNRLDRLVPGDEVIMSTLWDRHVYRVTGTEIVLPDAHVDRRADVHADRHAVRLPPAGLRPRAHRRAPRADDDLMPRFALALGGGFLVALSLPPWGWWPLAVVGVVVFELALGAWPERAARFWRGFAFGFGWLAMGIGWMWQLTVPGYIAASIVFASPPRRSPPLPRRTVAGG